MVHNLGSNATALCSCSSLRSVVELVNVAGGLCLVNSIRCSSLTLAFASWLTKARRREWEDKARTCRAAPFEVFYVGESFFPGLKWKSRFESWRGSSSNSNFAFAILDLLVSPFPKEMLQNCRAVILQNTRCKIAPVIQCRHLQKVHHTSRSAGEWICATENHTADPRVHERPCAHRARFLGHIQIAVRQPPIAQGCLGLSQCQHFRMRGGVFEQLHLIMGTSDDLACTTDNRADRHFAGFGRFVGHSQCFTHEVFISWGFKHVLVVATALWAV